MNVISEPARPGFAPSALPQQANPVFVPFSAQPAPQMRSTGLAPAERALASPLAQIVAGALVTAGLVFAVRLVYDALSDSAVVREETAGGYIVLRFPDNSWAFEHRFAVEQAMGKPIPAGMVVHHIDHNTRNNSLSNLSLLWPGEHQQLHNLRKWGGRQNRAAAAKIEKQGVKRIKG